MLFKGTPAKVINRFGYRFVADSKGELEIDIDTLVKKVVELDAEGAEFTTKEKLNDEEKAEILSAIKAYGFKEVINAKEEKKTIIK